MEIQRVLVYTENYLPSIGGLENNTALLCESLVLMGYRVTLVTPQKAAKAHHKFTVIESESLYRIYRVLKSHDLLLVNGGVSFKAIIPSLFCLKPFFIIYQMATLYKDIRNNGFKMQFLNFSRKLLAKQAKKNIAVSEYSYLALKMVFGNKKSGLLVNPADPIFSDKQEINFTKPLRCLIAGRLIEGKGVGLLIEAVKEINQDQYLIHLNIVGDGPDKGLIETAIKDSYISYHAPMPKEKLKAFFNQMHLTVIPSTSHIEGSPLIMAESFAMGIPVLASSQPAMMASVKNEHLVFESGSLNSLKEKLLYLTNENNYANLKQHSLKLAKTYSYVNYLKSLKLIINV